MIGSSLPGPFILEEKSQIIKVLELVHYKDVMEHNDCSKISSLGGHLYFVSHQVNKSKPFEYVICWFLNLIAIGSNKPSVEEIALSVKLALDRIPGLKLSGVVVLSTTEKTSIDSFFNGQVQVISLNVEPYNWHNAVMGDLQKVLVNVLWR